MSRTRTGAELYSMSVVFSKVVALGPKYSPGLIVFEVPGKKGLMYLGRWGGQYHQVLK